MPVSVISSQVFIYVAKCVTFTMGFVDENGKLYICTTSTSYPLLDLIVTELVI